MWKVKLSLKTYENDKIDYLKDMARAMHAKFNKYWNDFSLQICIASVLDPRNKLKFLKYAMKKLYDDPIMVDNEIKHVTKSMNEIYEWYVSKEDKQDISENEVQFASKDTSLFIFEFLDIF